MARHEDYEKRFAELASLAYQAAYRLSGDRSESEDVAQETLARAYVRWPRVRNYAEAWVVRVATNEVIGTWRRRRHHDRHRPDSVESDVEDVATQRLALTTALRSLPRRQREAVVLRYVGDLTIEATANAMGCSASSVKAHSMRALTALRRNGALHLDAMPPTLELTERGAPPTDTEPVHDYRSRPTAITREDL